MLVIFIVEYEFLMEEEFRFEVVYVMVVFGVIVNDFLGFYIFLDFFCFILIDLFGVRLVFFGN